MHNGTKRLAAFITGLTAILSCASGMAPPSSNNTADAASSKILAFPGAVGAGKYTTGGRGGEIYHVTNLNDSGTGSFRDAVSKPNRIVVFDVSGTIELKGNIICSDNITIAGQTAPGGSGITLKNYKMGMGGDNIICRYISSRPGPYASTSSGNDAWGGAKGSHSIIDHCSMGWTTDEQWGLYSNNEYYTVQYSVLGPADSWGGHSKGLHGFGIMMGKGYLTFDHNLIIHNVSRNFRGKVVGQETADFTNNVIYDWGYQTAYGTIGHLNYVNNFLKAGNSTTGGYHWMYVDSGTSPQNFKVYCDGNKMLNKDGSVHSITNDNWSGVTLKTAIGITMDDLHSYSPFQTVVDGEDLSTSTSCESADAAFDHVVSFAGNGISPGKRTAIDQQCASETKNGTGSCSGTAVYDESETKLDSYNIKCGVTYTYPDAVLQKEITDADNDGMDDTWELARGLDPSDPTDYKGDYCGQGYMNIEYYINDLTVNSFPEGVVELSPEAAVDPISAFETIEAESFTAQEGIRTEDTAGGGQNIGFVENGDWMMFRKVDFENGARTFKARMSGNPATIELYTGSIGTTPAAKINFPGTSGFGDYQDFEFNIPTISGTANLYLKFTGGEGYLLNMDSFVFGKEAIPLSGELFKNVQVSENAYPTVWAIAPSAAVGSRIFGDRDFTISELQTGLEGAEILLTACDAKNVSGDTATFTAGKDMKLIVGLDSRVEKAPEWLSSYTLMRTLLKASNDVTFMVYEKAVKAGEIITLGSNEQSYMCVNFVVLGVPDVSEPEALTGDVNIDGSVDLADIVTLSNHLLGRKAMTADQGKLADMDGDNTVDVFDLIRLRRAVFTA